MDDLEEDTLPSSKPLPRFAMPPPPMMLESLIVQRLMEVGERHLKLEKRVMMLSWVAGLTSLTLMVVTLANACR